ncbi:hypothetical protein D3C78_1530940 [compost metagenome]
MVGTVGATTSDPVTRLDTFDQAPHRNDSAGAAVTERRRRVEARIDGLQGFLQPLGPDLADYLPDQIRARLGLLQQAFLAHVDLGFFGTGADHRRAVLHQDELVVKCRDRNIVGFNDSGAQGLGDLFHKLRACDISRKV